MLVEPSTTWLLVRTSPLEVRIMPVPAAVPEPVTVLMSTTAGSTLAAIACAFRLPVLGAAGWIGACVWIGTSATGAVTAGEAIGVDDLSARARPQPTPTPLPPAAMAATTKATTIQRQTCGAPEVGGAGGAGGGGTHHPPGGGWAFGSRLVRIWIYIRHWELPPHRAPFGFLEPTMRCEPLSNLRGFLEVAEKPPRPFSHGLVHELPVCQLGRGAAGSLEGGQHPLSPRDFRRGRPEDLIDDRYLPGMNRRFAEEPQPPRRRCLVPKAFIVVDEDMHTVAWRRLSRGSACDDQKRACEQCLLLAAGDAEVGDEIQTSICDRGAGRMARDVEGREQSTRRFNRAIEGHPGCKMRHPFHIGSRFDLWQPQTFGHAGERGDVTSALVAERPVDPHPTGFLRRRPSDEVASPILQPWRDRVLEVEHDCIRAGVKDLGEKLLVVSGCKQPAPRGVFRLVNAHREPAGARSPCEGCRWSPRRWPSTAHPGRTARYRAPSSIRIRRVYA